MTIPPSDQILPVPIRFELLTARHNVAPFDCGNSTINDWLRQHAFNESIDEKYVTYVAVEEETENEDIVGYVAVRADFIRYPPKRKGGYEHVVPVMEIAYLGRDRRWKRRKIGLRLVLQALNVVLDVQDTMGGFAGVHLTSSEKAVSLYTGEELKFERHPASNRRCDYYKPIKDIRSLVRSDREQS